jgi:hypothetical protein
MIKVYLAKQTRWPEDNKVSSDWQLALDVDTNDLDTAYEVSQNFLPEGYCKKISKEYLASMRSSMVGDMFVDEDNVAWEVASVGFEKTKLDFKGIK